MNIGICMTSHGSIRRDERDMWLETISVEEMRVIEVARRAEQLGYHSIWFADHIVMDRAQDAKHVASNESGRKAYADRAVLLCPLVSMAMAAASTSTIEIASGVLIAPYRHPLSVAHQLATIDALSGGRVILGIGPGWLEGEFEALGVPFDDRGSRTEECIQIYKLAWTEEWLEFRGRFYDFADVSMEPKPVRKPHVPIVYGGLTAVGARRAVRHCDGFYPTFLDTHAEPSRYDHVREAIVDEADRVGRDLDDFQLLGLASGRITDESDPVTGRDRRPTLTGHAGQIISDLEDFAAHGYSHITILFDPPSGTTEGMLEQLDRFADEVLPAAHAIESAPLG